MTALGPAPNFEALQAALARRMSGRGLSDISQGTIVVIPSITFPDGELRKISGIVHYEERLLFMLLLLRNPSLKLVYVTSVAVDEAIIDYYLSFLHDASDARARLTLIAVGDASVESLSAKLLRQTEALERVAVAVEDRDQAYLLPFNVTDEERHLAEALGIALYGPHPDLIPLGYKSGSRHVARRAGVPVLDGAEDLYRLEDVEQVIMQLKENASESEAVVIKLNNGFSGQGNAIVSLNGPISPLTEAPTVFCGEGEGWDTYPAKLAREGGIVEVLVDRPGLVSPSVQLRIGPGGFVEVVSSHDQVLGGPSHQVYLGCQFPARPDYRMAIQDHALRVARVLSNEGVIGSFGIDFVGVPEAGGWRLSLSEINLRMGGTTHPYLMTSFVTQGEYNAATGELLAGGRPVSYFATDNMKSESYRGLSPADVIAATAAEGLAYDPNARTGVTLHLLGALPEFGKLGVVCIAEDDKGSGELYDATVDLLSDLSARRA